MRVFTTLRIAFAALLRNRLRSVLTILGIMVGIGAVICTVALGEGSAALIHQQMLNLGDNFIWLENGGSNQGGVKTGARTVPRLIVEDSDAIVSDIPEVARCSPNVDGHVQVIHGNQNWNTGYRGVSEDYVTIKAWPVVRGEPFTAEDVASRERVVILGQTVVTMLFGDDDPIGETVRVGSKLLTVVGVLKSRGQSTGGQDQDDTIFLPYTTAMRLLTNQPTVDDILCSARTPEGIKPAQAKIADLMRIRHHLLADTPDDFNIRAPDESIQLQEDTARTMGLMLSAVASVALLVSGVGVMNIMLVSVAERTREIGLRMAIGAREDTVRYQFLTEAVVLGLAGGAAGVIAGIIGARVFSDSLGWPMVISTKTIAVAVVFSFAVGIVFGYYPASRAASLDPIEALRTE